MTDVASLADADPAEVHVRKIRPVDVTRDLITSELAIIPATAFAFDDDLSLHREAVIEQHQSTVAVEYAFPTNGAVVVPLAPLIEKGGRAKITPNEDHPILGPAHASVFGPIYPRPSKTERNHFRRILMEHVLWVAKPQV